MDELERIRDAIDELRRSLESYTKSYNSNHTDALQRMTAMESWQSSHEDRDTERWGHLDEKLSELKGMLETIPMKVSEDVDKLATADEAIRQKLVEHESAIERIKTVWLTVSAIAAAALAVGEFLLHLKG